MQDSVWHQNRQRDTVQGPGETTGTGRRQAEGLGWCLVFLYKPL